MYQVVMEMSPVLERIDVQIRNPLQPSFGRKLVCKSFKAQRIVTFDNQLLKDWAELLI